MFEGKAILDGDLRKVQFSDFAPKPKQRGVWGISRTVAQIHALLYSRSALSAEEIADAFSVARCNVSTSLKEL
jgi:DNA-binding transcriptional regulator GbsR (MarR family)